MLTIDDSFFKAEIRNDFFINERMKHCWAAELKVLDIFDSLCQSSGLKYFVGYGTLIGAARHQGFIPWDDDMDIMMPREDFDRFIHTEYKKLPRYFDVSSYVTNENHDAFFAAIKNRTDIGDNEIITGEFYDCPFIIGMDIFPLDYKHPEEELEETRTRLFSAAYDVANKFEKYRLSGELDSLLDQLESLCNTKFDRSAPLRSQIWGVAHRLASLFSERECFELKVMTAGVVHNYPYSFKKSWIENIIELPYEMTKVKAPGEYKDFLNSIYGDYTVMRQYAAGHDYPFFKKQIPFLKKPERYSVTEEK